MFVVPFLKFQRETHANHLNTRTESGRGLPGCFLVCRARDCALRSQGSPSPGTFVWGRLCPHFILLLYDVQPPEKQHRRSYESPRVVSQLPCTISCIFHLFQILVARHARFLTVSFALFDPRIVVSNHVSYRIPRYVQQLRPFASPSSLNVCQLR